MKAASGIGKETAFTFADAGVHGVVFADINYEGARYADEVSKGYARHTEYRAFAANVDISDSESVQDLILTTVKEIGRIDYAVNSAGVSLALVLSACCTAGDTMTKSHI